VPGGALVSLALGAPQVGPLAAARIGGGDEVAQRAGCPALLVEDASQIPPEMLIGVERVGVTAGASAPESLVEGVVRAIDGLGSATLSERTVATEDIHFKLPAQLRANKVM